MLPYLLAAAPHPGQRIVGYRRRNGLGPAISPRMRVDVRTHCGEMNGNSTSDFFCDVNHVIRPHT